MENLQVISVVGSKIDKYTTWALGFADGRTGFVYLANQVLHLEIEAHTTKPELRGVVLRKVVECPGGQMCSEEMLSQLGLTHV